MKVLKCRDYEDEEYLKRVYTLDDNIQVDMFMNIVRSFETESTKMFKCRCQSFDEDGHPLHSSYTSIEEISETKNFPNPYIRFYVEFRDRTTNTYKFNLEANVNSNLVMYSVDKKKITIDSTRNRSR